MYGCVHCNQEQDSSFILPLPFHLPLLLLSPPFPPPLPPLSLPPLLPFPPLSLPPSPFPPSPLTDYTPSLPVAESTDAPVESLTDMLAPPMVPNYTPSLADPLQPPSWRTHINSDRDILEDVSNAIRHVIGCYLGLVVQLVCIALLVAAFVMSSYVLSIPNNTLTHLIKLPFNLPTLLV